MSAGRHSSKQSSNSNTFIDSYFFIAEDIILLDSFAIFSYFANTEIIILLGSYFANGEDVTILVSVIDIFEAFSVILGTFAITEVFNDILVSFPIVKVSIRNFFQSIISFDLLSILAIGFERPSLW